MLNITIKTMLQVKLYKNKKCVIKVQRNNFKHSLQDNTFALPKPIFEI